MFTPFFRGSVRFFFKLGLTEDRGHVFSAKLQDTLVIEKPTPAAKPTSMFFNLFGDQTVSAGTHI